MVATFGSSWTLSALTPLAIAGLLGILASQITGILALLPPSVKQREKIAVMSGVHDEADIDKIQAATAPGIVPTPAMVAAVLDKEVQADGITLRPKAVPVTAKVDADVTVRPALAETKSPEPQKEIA